MKRITNRRIKAEDLKGSPSVIVLSDRAVLGSNAYPN